MGVLMSKTVGDSAERIACEYLQDQGLLIVARNFYSRYGEIDVIAVDQHKNLCFIEVKARKLKHQRIFAQAVESVSLSKQKKTINTAQVYLQNHAVYDDYFCRFDVITIEYEDVKSLELPLKTSLKDSLIQLQWIQHAYTL